MGRAVVVVKYFCGPVSAQLLARSCKPLVSGFGITEDRLRQSQNESQLEGDIAVLLAQAGSLRPDLSRVGCKGRTGCQLLKHCRGQPITYSAQYLIFRDGHR